MRTTLNGITVSNSNGFYSINVNSNQDGVPYLTGPSDFGGLTPNITKWTTSPKIFAKKNEVKVLTSIA